jgi:hypothetical protein
MLSYLRVFKDAEVQGVGLRSAWHVLVGLVGLVQLGCHSPPRAQFPSVASALSHLEKQTSCSRAVQGEANLVVSAPLYKQTGQLLYKAEAPDRLRFDLYSSFGITLSTLSSDGRDFALYNLDQKSFHYGPAKTCNIERFTRVAVPPFALVELLRGRPPVLSHRPEQASIEFKSSLFSRGRYVIEVQGTHQSEQRLELEVPVEDWEKPIGEQRLRLSRVRVDQAGDLLYEVELAGHRPAVVAPNVLSVEEREMGILPYPPSGPDCAAEIPRTIAFSVPGTGATLTIENKEVFHNPPQVPGAFRQDVPHGVKSLFSDCSD